MIRITTLLLALVLVASASFSQARNGADPGVLDALRSMDGRWAGTLAYRDYQSGQLVTLPARMTCEAARSGPYLAQRLEFDDPGRTVMSSQVVALGPNAKRLSVLSDEGLEQFEIIERRVESPSAWTIVLSTRGTDDGRPADIRRTQQLNGDELSLTTETRSPDGDDDWTMRNRLRLTRVAPDASQLVRAWRVDLRPTPDAEGYFQPFRVDSVEGGVITGAFYGTPIENGRIDTSWGLVRFAFTTSDDSGVYHTSGVLRDGQLEGTTHSLGRRFLSVWSAVPAD